MCISRVNKSFTKKIIYRLDNASEMVYNINVIKKQPQGMDDITSEEDTMSRRQNTNDMPVDAEHFTNITIIYRSGRVVTKTINFYQAFCDTSLFVKLRAERDKIAKIYRIDVDATRFDRRGYPITTIPIDISDILWVENPIADEEIPLF